MKNIQIKKIILLALPVLFVCSFTATKADTYVVCDYDNNRCGQFSVEIMASGELMPDQNVKIYSSFERPTDYCSTSFCGGYIVQASAFIAKNPNKCMFGFSMSDNISSQNEACNGFSAGDVDFTLPVCLDLENRYVYLDLVFNPERTQLPGFNPLIEVSSDTTIVENGEQITMPFLYGGPTCSSNNSVPSILVK